MSDTRRFIELDGLRAVAAVAVLVGHYTATFDTDIGGAPLAGWRFLYGAFGVQLFFLISGYVILMTARRAHRPADFAISRVSRLYPAYWMALALTLAVIAVWPQVPFPSFGAVLVNATMVQRWFLVPDINDVSWTLAVEMQFYILVFALLALTRCHLRRRTVLLALWVWVAIGVLTVIVLTVPVPEFAALHETTTTKILLNLTLAEYAPLFAAGCLTFLARTKELSWWSPLTMLAIAVVISGVLHGAAYGRGCVSWRPSSQWSLWFPACPSSVWVRCSGWDAAAIPSTSSTRPWVIRSSRRRGGSSGARAPCCSRPLPHSSSQPFCTASVRCGRATPSGRSCSDDCPPLTRGLPEPHPAGTTADVRDTADTQPPAVPSLACFPL